MVIGIGLMTFIGYKLDIYFSFNFPVFLLFFVLSSLTGFIYHLYKVMQE